MPPPLPSKDDFRDATKNSNPFAMRKGIARIDEALHLWETKGHTTENAVLLFRECRHWLALKENEDGANTEKRRQKVHELLGKVTQWLVHLDQRLGAALLEFERRKDGGAHLQAKPMPGVYAAERKVYLDNKKTFAPSATKLNNFAQGLGAEGQLPDKFPNTFGEFTEKQFLALEKMCKEQHGVLYLKKIERLRYMLRVSPLDHRFIDFNGNPAGTTGSAGWPYAMDRYGSLFVIDAHGSDQQVNHSTLNAGKEVICAGMIKIEAGVLKRINNNSGHYKPGQKNLYNAIQMLVGERADLSQCKVELWDYQQEPGWMNLWEFDARDFRAEGHANGVNVGRTQDISMPLRG